MRFSRFRNQPQVLQFLIDVARAGKPCPTNAQMANDLGAGCTSTIADVLRDLRAEGSIVVKRSGVGRIIAIPRLNLETAPRPPKAFVHPVHHHRDFEKLRHVSRDPCFRCGVRADIGCHHRRVA